MPLEVERKKAPLQVEVSLKAIENNVRSIRRWVGYDTQFMAVVKANAYGHGIQRVAAAALSAGATHVGVSNIREASELRSTGIDSPIVVMSPFEIAQAEAMVEYSLTPFVSNRDQLTALAVASQKLNREVSIHIEVDTGMGRSGCLPTDLKSLIYTAHQHPKIKIMGVATHFPSADSDPEFTQHQIALFKQLIDDLRPSLQKNILIHAANSAGSLLFPESTLDLVRPGLLMYGIWPCPVLPEYPDLMPAMQITSRVKLIRCLPDNWSISYGRTAITNGKRIFATIDVGYGDGYPRELSNKGHVLIRGLSAPIVGRVCMDVTVVDVTDNPNCSVGDEVVLLGSQGNSIIRAEELSQIIGTTEHDITTRLTGRASISYS